MKIAKFKDQVVRMKRFEEYYLSNPEVTLFLLNSLKIFTNW